MRRASSPPSLLHRTFLSLLLASASRAGLAVIVLGGVVVATPALAQTTTSTIRGVVTGQDGAPIAGAEVMLRHEPTGNTKMALTNASGTYAFSGLRVGGPYSVTVTAFGFDPQGRGDIYLAAGKPASVPVTMVGSGEVVEMSESSTAGSTSGRKVFGSKDIGETPAIGRDPKEVVRLTPEAYLSGENRAMSIGGANNRFNSVTVDGIRQDDDFGLNQGGYPTQRSPISLSAIEEIGVELSPFDVRYGQFLGGNVNIVTKSGTNEFHGSLLTTFANQALTGSKSKDDKLDVDFREARLGFTLGGPIIKDKLHFFVGVEGLSARTPTSVGPAGSGASHEVMGVTAADLARAQQITRDVYDFDAGQASRALHEDDLKVLAKVDWAIDAKHRLSTKYQLTTGNDARDALATDTLLPLTSSWYDQRDTLHAFSLRLFSDWTSSLSTEAELSGKFVKTRQVPLNGNGFMSASVDTVDGGTIVLGPDPFRHTNRLDDSLIHGRVLANYLVGTNLFTGGVEYDRLGVFNVFVPNSNGTAEYDSLDAYEARMPSRITYQNAISGNPDDAAADWGYGTAGFFLQDMIELTSKLNLQGGARFEVYQAGTDITENPNFVARYGFSNTSTINGKTVILPRLGASYRPLRDLNLRGGVGLYSGGTPNVWLSNSYSNNGVNIDTVNSSDPAVVNGFDGRNLPASLRDGLMAGDGNVDALDPHFKIPSSWKSSLGADYGVDWGLGRDHKLGLSVNYVYTKVRYGMRWQDLRRDLPEYADNAPVGTLPDGRPFYDFDNTDMVQFNARRGYDLLLTNTKGGHGHTLSFSLNQGFPFGLDLYGAYAYQNVKDINPAASSRSSSNYGQVAVVDPQNPTLATSDYERAHRILGSVRFSRSLISDISGLTETRWKSLLTSVTFLWESRSGQPYSYTFGDASRGQDLARLFGEDVEFARRNRELFYVPRGDGSDVTLMGIDPAEFDAYLKSTGLDKYRGQIAPRNAFRSSWVHRLDFRFQQDLPSPWKGQKGRFMVDVENLGNLLNKDWGRSEQVPFPYMTPAVDVAYDPATKKYVYSNLRTQDPQRVDLLGSIWRIQLTLAYDF